MIDYFNSLDWVMQLYIALAILGGIIFIIQLVMLFLGSGGFGDIGDTDVSGGSMDASAYALKFFSFQNLSGFFLMFGFIGAYTQNQTHNEFISFFAALVSGLIISFVMSKFMKMMLKLQSSGNINYQTAVGLNGTVYLNIPANGCGQIQIAVKGRMIYPNAVSVDHVEIKTGTRISVVSVGSDNTMVVKPE
jgi:hypothetical protein